jgi:Uma2 family endonuclease
VSPSTPHSAITLDFAMAVNLFARRRKLARAFPELRSTYGGMSTVPAVAVYTWDRIPRDGRGQLATQVFTPPDIAAEIRSPDQTFESNLIRCLWYVANEVQVAIAIEPRQRLLVAFRPESEPSIFSDSGVLDLSDVIPGFQLDLSDVIPGFQLDVGELFSALIAG